MIVMIPMGDFAWGMLVDGKKTQLGLLLNVVVAQGHCRLRRCHHQQLTADQEITKWVKN